MPAPSNSLTSSAGHFGATATTHLEPFIVRLFHPLGRLSNHYKKAGGVPQAFRIIPAVPGLPGLPQPPQKFPQVSLLHINIRIEFLDLEPHRLHELLHLLGAVAVAAFAVLFSKDPGELPVAQEQVFQRAGGVPVVAEIHLVNAQAARLGNPGQMGEG